MVRLLSDNSVSFDGVEYPSVNGVVDVPDAAAQVLMESHGLQLAPAPDAEPVIPLRRRRGEPLIEA